MARFDTAQVWLDAERFEQPALMGALHSQTSGAGEIFSFEYSREWLEREEAFAFDPDLAQWRARNTPRLNAPISASSSIPLPTDGDAC